MSIKWFRACFNAPKESEKCLVCFKGVYYLGHYDKSSDLFQLEGGSGNLQIAASDEELFWARLIAAGSADSVLVVDDDPDDLNEIVSAVREVQPGIVIETAQNGTQALQHLTLKMLSKNTPKIILLDLFMPESDGFTVLRELRAKSEFEKTMVYVLSSSFSVDDWSRAKNLGANGVFHKSHAKIELARIFGAVKPVFNEKNA